MLNARDLLYPGKLFMTNIINKQITLVKFDKKTFVVGK